MRSQPPGFLLQSTEELDPVFATKSALARTSVRALAEGRLLERVAQWEKDAKTSISHTAGLGSRGIREAWIGFEERIAGWDIYGRGPFVASTRLRRKGIMEVRD